MTDNIQTRIREYLAGDNDECPRKLLREAANELEGRFVLDVQWGFKASPFAMLYRSPPEAWPKR